MNIIKGSLVLCLILSGCGGSGGSSQGEVTKEIVSVNGDDAIRTTIPFNTEGISKIEYINHFSAGMFRHKTITWDKNSEGNFANWTFELQSNFPRFTDSLSFSQSPDLTYSCKMTYAEESKLSFDKFVEKVKALKVYNYNFLDHNVRDIPDNTSVRIKFFYEDGSSEVFSKSVTVDIQSDGDFFRYLSWQEGTILENGEGSCDKYINNK